jgi:hypothetical protein
LGRFFENGLRLVTTATAISTIATAATFSAAATTFSAATAAATEAAATTAAFALFHRTRFIDGQGTAIDFLAMELGDGSLRFLGRSHFHETEATGTSRYAVIDHLNPGDIARLGKEIGQVVFRHAEGQIAHIEFYAHFFLLGWLADVSGIGSTLPLS